MVEHDETNLIYDSLGRPGWQRQEDVDFNFRTIASQDLAHCRVVAYGSPLKYQLFILNRLLECHYLPTIHRRRPLNHFANNRREFSDTGSADLEPGRLAALSAP